MMEGPDRSNRRRFLVCALLLSAALLSAQTVWISKSGSKYHVAGCRYLGTSATAIDLAEAVAREYEPCSVCNPPILAITRNPHSALGRAPLATGMYRVNAAGLRTSASADVRLMLPARVTRTIDGDTVVVALTSPPRGIAGKETVRLIGVDTPETVDRRKAVQAFGKEASTYAKQHLDGKSVFLAFDWDLRDKYRRLLAYIYLPDGTCFNAQLVREGYGHAYVQFPFQFMEEFRGLEAQARRQNRGLWHR
jgi:micrococcal nuclease